MALYRGRVADAIPPGVPPEAAEAARDTLGGAVVAGEGLPDPLAAELLEGARDAFAQGLQLAAVTSAVLAVATAVVAAVLLRRVRVSPSAPEGA
jgi:DHA2 family multidrug resistance protein-like MFS transporter